MYPMRVLTLLLLPAVVATVGCGDATSQHDGPKAPEVYVTAPIQGKRTDYEIFTGRVESPRSVDIRAHVTGYLDWAYFKEGREVHEGDLLARIDPRSFQATYQQTEALLAQAIVHRDRLGQDYLRDSGLYRKGKDFIATADYDKTVGDYKEAEAAVKSAIANRDLARVNLNYCTITAPFSGRISRRAIDPGNLVKADDTVITTLVRTDKMWVYFDVDERTRNTLVRKRADGKLGTDSQANLTVHMGLAVVLAVGGDAEPDLTVRMGLADDVDKDGKPLFPHAGRIDFEDNRLDPLTGTLRMRAVFENQPMGSEKGPRLLSPGLFARVQLPVSEARERILIPEQALSTDQGEKFLYIVKDLVGNESENTKEGVVEYRKVKIGAQHEGYRVIEDGLKMGESVIVSGLQRARPKIKVRVKDATKEMLPDPNSHTTPTDVPYAIKLRPEGGAPGGPKTGPQPSTAGGS
jgi:RND family efflux transporter MFP subunit